MPAIRVDVLLISDDELSARRLALREESVNKDGTLTKKLDIPVTTPAKYFDDESGSDVKLVDDDALLALVRDVCSRLRT